MTTDKKVTIDYDDYRALRKGLLASGSRRYKAYDIDSKIRKIISPFEQNREGRVKRLSLCDGNLQKAFPFLTKLKHLEHLVLAHCGITSIPEDIGEMISLKLLCLFRNKISEVPPSFGRLKNLTALDLLFTNLKALPKEFGDLTNLVELGLPLEFPFQSCLDVFGNMTSLMYLEVSFQRNATNLLNVQGRAQNLLSVVRKCRVLGCIKTYKKTIDLGTDVEYALASNRAMACGSFTKNGLPPKLWPHVLGSAEHAVAEYPTSPVFKLSRETSLSCPMPISDVVFLLLNANMESFVKVLIERSRICQNSFGSPSRKRRKKRSPTSRKKLR